jgi:hypothetical protein
MMKNKVLSLLAIGTLLALSGCCCWRKSSCNRSYDYCDGDEYGMYEGRHHEGHYMGPEGEYPRMIDGEYVKPYDRAEDAECYRPYDGKVDDSQLRRAGRKMSRKERRAAVQSMKHDVMPAEMPDHGG